MGTIIFISLYLLKNICVAIAENHMGVLHPKLTWSKDGKNEVRQTIRHEILTPKQRVMQFFLKVFEKKKLTVL